MKRSISVLLMLLTLCPVLWAESNDITFFLLSTRRQRRFEERLNYTVIPLERWKVIFSGNSINEKRYIFDQTSNNTQLSFLLSRDISHGYQYMQSGYEYLWDKSALESNLQPYRNRTAFLGYGVSITPADSLNLNARARAYYRDERDRYAADRRFISKGYWLDTNSRWWLADSLNSLALKASYQNKKLNYEAFTQCNGGLDAALQRETYSLSAGVTYNTKNEGLYILAPPDTLSPVSTYTRTDTQSRHNLDLYLSAILPGNEYWNMDLQEQYYSRSVHLTQNTLKDNADYDNRLRLHASYTLFPSMILQGNALHEYMMKALYYNDQSRIMETRYADAGLYWEYAPEDSLTAIYAAELKRTSYPDADHQLDNDYLTQSLNAGWIHYYYDRLRLTNRVIYAQKQEVFIDELLSASNNTVRSYIWQPGVDLLWGDCFALLQSYRLRADYDNYLYSSFSGIRDTFFRQCLVNWHFIYDSTPLITNVGDNRWLRLPFRQRSNDALRLDMGYNWERNETSARTANTYYINGRNDKQTLSLLIQKQVGISVYSVEPRYSWGTWKEYSLMLLAGWHFNPVSYGEITLYPVGETLDSLDWRLTCSLSLVF